jgi:hypothetical protein
MLKYGRQKYSKYMGYAIAIATSIAYAVWYIGSNSVMSMSSGTYAPILPLLLVEIISSFLVFLIAKGKIRLQLSQLPYPVISGALFALGNYLFYVVIGGSGVAPASAFASAEIVIFTAMLALTSRHKSLVSLSYAGSVFIAGGMIMESLTLNGQSLSFNPHLLVLGVLIALIYGIATYFFYLSTRKIDDTLSVMFPIQFTEVILFGIAFVALLPVMPMPHFNTFYISLIILLGVMLMASFYLETLVLKILVPFGRSAVATGYILSDLQLLPVIAFVLITQPGMFDFYLPGLFFITFGMMLLDWK